MIKTHLPLFTLLLLICACSVDDTSATGQSGSDDNGSLRHEENNDSYASDANISFNQTIFPILKRRCYECHNPDSYLRDYEFVLDITAATSYTEVKFSVNVSDPESSALLQKGSRNEPHSGGVRLPFAGSDYNTVLTWIRQGALEN